MDEKLIKKNLSEQLKTLEAASNVLRESYERVRSILKEGNKKVPTIEEKESCEALTARFARLCDFLFQRVFRTIDVLELQDEGTGIDRLNRMEKRGLITSTRRWREFRDLRNRIAHEYLIEKSDQVLKDAFEHAGELMETVEKLKAYVSQKKYVR